MLTIEVYRASEFPDCTNGGPSSQYNRICVVNIKGPNKTVPDNSTPMILESHTKGCLRLVPAFLTSSGDWKRIPGWFMMGGNFGHTSDSRFSGCCRALLQHDFYGAVAIHDRIE